jgi:hypothetical protein
VWLNILSTRIEASVLCFLEPGYDNHLLLLLETKSSRATKSVGRLLLLLKTKCSRATRIVSRLLLLETKRSRATRSLGYLRLLLKSQSSRTPRGKGRVLLWLKTKTSRTPRGKGHLLLLSKTFIYILLQSNQSSCPALIEFLLHSSLFMGLLRIVCLVAFLFQGRKFRTSIRMLVEKCLKLLNHPDCGGWTQKG